MKKVIAYTKSSYLHGGAHKLECCNCGEDDRNKLEIEDIGISVGIGGEDYTFCKKCWHSKTLGRLILEILGRDKIKIIDENLELKEVE